jgi:hypothetical protein
VPPQLRQGGTGFSLWKRFQNVDTNVDTARIIEIAHNGTSGLCA